MMHTLKLFTYSKVLQPLLLLLFLSSAQLLFAGDRAPIPNLWGDFFVYQKNNGAMVIRILASNDQGCNDMWDQLYIKYVTKDGVSHNVIRIDNNSFSGSSVLKDPNDNIYHYYKAQNGHNVTRTGHQDSDGGDFYIEFTWHDPPANIRRKNNFYLTGLWRACTDDWIGDWRYNTVNNTPWKRTCHLLDGGLTGQFNTSKKEDILRYWAPRVFHDTRNDDVWIFPMKYPFYWEQEIFGPVDFDNDWDSRNNWEHNAGNWESSGGTIKVPKSYVYTSFVETSTHYYLGYMYFHPTDDAEFMPADRHENDMEDVFICIKKGSQHNGFGSFQGMVTNSHGDYLKYTKNQVTLALGHHPQIYITSNGIGLGSWVGWNDDHGHSIYAYNGNYKVNFSDFGGGDGIVFNISNSADHIQSNPVMQGYIPILNTFHAKYPVQAYYDILDIDELWSLRHTTNHKPFMSYADFGGEGSDGKGPGAHTPWPEQVFYDPARYFNSRFQLSGSTSYTYNPYYRNSNENPDSMGSERSRALRGELPSGWSEKVISNNRSVSYYTHGDLTISAKGNGANDYHLFYRTAPDSDGKVQLVAKVDRVRQNITSLTRVGLRVSSGTHNNNPYVAIYQQPNGKVTMEYRTEQSGTVKTIYGGGATNKNKYFKINRDGNKWYCFYSLNKSNWEYVGSAALNVTNPKIGVYLDANIYNNFASVSINEIKYQKTPNFNPPADNVAGGGDNGGPGPGGPGPGGPGPDDPDPIGIDGPEGDGIFDHPHNTFTSVFPNPGNGDELTVALENVKSPELVKVTIYSMEGDVVYSNEYENLDVNSTIPLKGLHLDKGIYMVVTKTSDQTLTNKVMIE